MNGVAISIGAFVLGISSLERHITIDRTMYGSDCINRGKYAKSD